MNEQSFEDAVSRICEKDGDYDAEAYYFVRESLDRTVRALGREDAKDRHVTGQELCEGIRAHALEQFGPLSLLVLSQWGVFETADFGRIVHALVNEGVFGKKPTDSVDDFKDVYSFEEAFEKPYAP